ncbi:bifunctional histidinol-phosphatase/imidazoleglycerol-phosphate dehydratase HisB [Candidatus Hoaglandella endobia]|uniref:Imidazoleglycerol-phosphate dehydratase n=1 Tax=Candidatus Hoaglandella endobia TaxID=1778263 RepID=A0A143WTE3_9ENTR|nr:bifunctional histidinol-phosphatase/imidazoleglycerol-phosphate dehydratase HisB [Candidatus Hoaglandella endobia]CUX97109.1 Histidine biosynthesis bifunctional protein HisB [Candidatus Hoaglandella endobia]
MKHKVLFINRDGTLIRLPPTDDKSDSMETLAMEPDVIPTLLALKKAGFSLVMIITQDNHSTNSLLPADFNRLHNLLMNIFISQGIVFDDVLIFPHLIADYCGCHNTMIMQWLQVRKLDITHSYVISDKKIDIMPSENVRIACLHYQRENLNWQTIGEQLTCRDRYAQVNRITRETDINVEVWLDREGNSFIKTGISFFDHMLNQIATHGGLRLHIRVQGDLHIDDHHTVEDTALALGEAIKNALGDKHGIGRFGFVLPMDECLARCALDISGRPHLEYKAKYSYHRVGDLSTEMVEHFFRSLSYTMACTLHLSTKGKNDHHRVESLFKAFGRTLRQAISVEGDALPSSKGVL